MTCSRILTTIGSSQRRRSIQSLVGASTKEGTTKRGIGNRSLPSTASSYLSTASPTRFLMSPMIVDQSQSDHPNHLRLNQPLHQKNGQQRKFTSVFSNIVECSTQQNLTLSSTNICLVSGVRELTSASKQLSSRNTTLHTHATANPLVAGNKKPPASGWKKPIVSSSLSLSSYVEPTNPSDSSASASAETMSISLSSSPSEATATISENTVGVDMEELLKLASKKTTPLSLKDMYKYAIVDADNREQRIRNAQFLHSE